MKKIAVIGLGIMGHGIADNFLKNGHELYVWNRHPDKANDLKGAIVCASPKEATEKADIVFEVTANDESSREVWTGKDGILAGAGPAKYLIASATLSVDWIEELAKKSAAAGANFFDMPLTGGRKGAESGELILLVGGNEKKLQEIKPDLKSIAKDVRYFGPAGSGTKYKLVLNTFQGMILASFGEVIRMAKQAGLDEKKVIESLQLIPGGYTVEVAGKSYLNPPDPINFSLAWETKDLNYAKRMAEGNYPLRDIVVEKFNKANDAGHGPDDWTKVNKV